MPGRRRANGPIAQACVDVRRRNTEQSEKVTDHARNEVPLLFGLRLLRTLPAFECHLLRARQGELTVGGFLGDGAARTRGRVTPDAHRRDQHVAGTDECAIRDGCRPLVHAIVVAGDRAGADVHVGADGRVADVGEVIRLAAIRDGGLLQLDEIADVHAGAELAAGPYTGKRTDEAS